MVLYSTLPDDIVHARTSQYVQSCAVPPVPTTLWHQLPKNSQQQLQPIDKWEICLHNVYPSYITWEEFLANQAQLRSNHLDYQEEEHIRD